MNSIVENPILNIQEDIDESTIESDVCEDIDCRSSDGYDSNIDNEEECKHEDTMLEGKSVICTSCGLQIDNKISYEKEWRYYGNEDTKHSCNPSRCHPRKSEERTISKDVENVNLPKQITDIANKIYQQVTSKQIYRGTSRRAIIFACIFLAYKEIGQPQSPERIGTLLGVTKNVKRNMSKGMKVCNKYRNTSESYTTPIDLVPNILKDLNAPIKMHLEEIKNIYMKIEGRSSLLNRSTPQSTAASLVYYYCKKIGKNITRQAFASIVNLSEITIVNKSQEISKILETSHIKL